MDAARLSALFLLASGLKPCRGAALPVGGSNNGDETVGEWLQRENFSELSTLQGGLHAQVTQRVFMDLEADGPQPGDPPTSLGRIVIGTPNHPHPYWCKLTVRVTRVAVTTVWQWLWLGCGVRSGLVLGVKVRRHNIKIHNGGKRGRGRLEGARHSQGRGVMVNWLRRRVS